MIQSIEFIEGYWFPLEKETQKRFKIKTLKPTKNSRDKNPYKIFYLFEKGTIINFKEKVNVIVGENGSGKSTLIKIFNDYAGKMPNRLTLALSDFENEEKYYQKFIELRNTEKYEFKITGDITYRNSIFFDAEKDNPILSIPKILNPNDKNFPFLANELINAQEESHGESLIPIIDYILDNSINYTIFMDEPETALSLKNQLRFSKKIIESSEKRNNQIIISTHSLLIIKQFDEIFDMETKKWIKTNDYLKSLGIN